MELEEFSTDDVQIIVPRSTNTGYQIELLKLMKAWINKCFQIRHVK